MSQVGVWSFEGKEIGLEAGYTVLHDCMISD